MNATILLLPLLLMVIVTPTAIAHALTPYQSGYKHGVKDANMTYGLSNFMDKGGFAKHTERFNQGYIDGWCLGQPGAGSDSNNGTFECYADTTAAKSNSTR